MAVRSHSSMDGSTSIYNFDLNGAKGRDEISALFFELKCADSTRHSLQKRRSFVYESTMAKLKKYNSLFTKLKKEGYGIQLYIAEAPLSLARKRAAERTHKDVRVVPNRIIVNTHIVVALFDGYVYKPKFIKQRNLDNIFGAIWSQFLCANNGLNYYRLENA